MNSNHVVCGPFTVSDGSENLLLLWWKCKSVASQ